MHKHASRVCSKRVCFSSAKWSSPARPPPAPSRLPAARGGAARPRSPSATALQTACEQEKPTKRKICKSASRAPDKTRTAKDKDREKPTPASKVKQTSIRRLMTQMGDGSAPADLGDVLHDDVDDAALGASARIRVHVHRARVVEQVGPGPEAVGPDLGRDSGPG